MYHLLVVVTFLLLEISGCVASTSGILPIFPCSVNYCSKNGAFKFCTNSEPDLIVTCGKWYNRPEAHESCKLECEGSCYFIPLLGSDGKLYCTPCHLRLESCRSGFKIYGPVPPPSPSPIYTRPVVHTLSSIEASSRILSLCSMEYCTSRGYSALCHIDGSDVLLNTCAEYHNTEKSRGQCLFVCNLRCLPEGQRFLASNGKIYCSICQLQSASCASKFKVYGPLPHSEPISDRNLVMRSTKRPSLCSMTYCTFRGSEAICFFHDKLSLHIPTTCKIFSKTEESKRQCEFACTEECPLEGRPLANNGIRYCTLCQLQEASCNSNFDIYGPLVTIQPTLSPKPQSSSDPDEDVCSAGYCTSKGAKEQCTFDDEEGMFRITCGKFAFSDKSKEECSFNCPQICLPSEQQPLGSDGKFYCSPCILASSSCSK